MKVFCDWSLFAWEFKIEKKGPLLWQKSSSKHLYIILSGVLLGCCSLQTPGFERKNHLYRSRTLLLLCCRTCDREY